MKLKLTVEIEVNEASPFFDESSEEERRWFFNDVLGSNELYLIDRAEYGDDIAKAKVTNCEVINPRDQIKRN